MCAGSEKNEKSTIDNVVMAKYLRSELLRQSLPAALSPELLAEIGYFSDTKNLGQFSQASSEMNFLFKAPLNTRKLLRTVFDADLGGKATRLIDSIPPQKGDIVLERVYGERKSVVDYGGE